MTPSPTRRFMPASSLYSDRLRPCRLLRRLILPSQPVLHFCPFLNQRFFCTSRRASLFVERFGIETAMWETTPSGRQQKRPVISRHSARPCFVFEETDQASERSDAGTSMLHRRREPSLPQNTAGSSNAPNMRSGSPVRNGACGSSLRISRMVRTSEVANLPAFPFAPGIPKKRHICSASTICPEQLAESILFHEAAGHDRDLDPGSGQHQCRSAARTGKHRAQAAVLFR